MSNLKAIISADTSGLKKNVEEATKILEQYVGTQNKATNQNRIANGVSIEQVNAYKRVVTLLQKVGSGTMTLTQQEKALKNQIQELKAQWANLNDTAKRSDFGKSLSNSARAAENQLKQLRGQMNSMKETTTKAKTSVGGLSTQFTSLTSLLGGYASLIGAVTGAMKVLKDAFLSSEEGIDEWGRTLEATKSVYKTFCVALSNGNWLTFFSNLGNAIRGARELYDALDKLGSVKSNNQAAIAIQEQALAQLRLQKQQGKNVDDQIKEVEKRLAQLRKQEVDAGKEAGIKTMVEAIKNQNGDVSEEMAKQIAENILNNGDAAYTEMAKEVEKLKSKAGTKQVTEYSTTMYGTPLKRVKSVQALENLTQAEREKLKAYEAAISAETPIAEGIKVYADAVRTDAQSAKETFKYDRWLKKDDTKVAPKTKKALDFKVNIAQITVGRSKKQIEADLKKAKEQYDNAGTAIGRSFAKKMIDELTDELKNLDKTDIQKRIENDIKNIKVRPYVDYTNGAYKEEEPPVVDYKGGAEGLKSMLDSSLQLYSIWGGIAQNFDDLDAGEKFFAITDAIMGTVESMKSFVEGVKSMTTMIKTLQAVSSVASKAKLAENEAENASNMKNTGTNLGKAASSIFGANSGIPVVGVAIAIGLIATMMAAMAAFSFKNGGIVGKYANGGIPKYAGGGGVFSGSTTMGDFNLARVNSGEMILNGTQQARLFRMLNGSMNNANTSVGQVDFRISGDALYGVLRNYSKISQTTGKNIGIK